MNDQVAADEIAGMRDRLIELSSVSGVDDAAGVDVIAALERLKAGRSGFPGHRGTPREPGAGVEHAVAEDVRVAAAG
jgi:hypothetical protein